MFDLICPTCLILSPCSPARAPSPWRGPGAGCPASRPPSSSSSPPPARASPASAAAAAARTSPTLGPRPRAARRRGRARARTSASAGRRSQPRPPPRPRCPSCRPRTARWTPPARPSTSSCSPSLRRCPKISGKLRSTNQEVTLYYSPPQAVLRRVQVQRGEVKARDRVRQDPRAGVPGRGGEECAELNCRHQVHILALQK